MSKNQFIVFVCSACGEIKIMDTSNWQSSPSESFSLPENLILEPFHPIENWPQFKNFQKTIEESQEISVPKFPLCEQCMEYSISHLKTQNEFFTQYLNSIDSITNYSASFKNAQIQASDIASPFIKRRNSRPSFELRKTKEDLSENNSKPATTPDNQPIPRNIKPNYAQISAFRFSIEGIFAKINGLRLGKTKLIPVPTREIQNALYFLCRYLIYQMKLAQVDSSNIQVTYQIIFTSNSSTKILNFPEKPRDINSFNSALNDMMDSFNKLFNSSFFSAMRPSILIDPNKHTIDGRSYYYSESDPGEFARAMRKLILSLKTIQSFQTVLSP